ncbi:MAG TPA: ABC transporter ATP-binding protein [Candidatus Binatia bacterium]|jgi:ATP-binding cassette subfamily B protein|nr:ABC transporter ATP-binding protein [Candidatus Binatia bacterium]
MNQIMHQEDEILGKAYDARLVARMLKYLRPYWRLLSLSAVLLVLYTATQLLGPYITKVAIDRYIATGDAQGLNLMVVIYLGSVFLGFVLLFAQTYSTEYTGQRAMHDLRVEIFSHLQKQDLAYFDRNPVGRLMTRTIHDVETLNELFSTGVIGLLGDACVVFGIAGAMLLLNWKLALVTLAAFPLILYVSGFYRRRAKEVYRESRLILAKINATLQENIAGIGTIQAFGQEEGTYDKFQRVNLDYRDLLLRSIRYNALFFPLIEVFSALTIGLALWYGGNLILAGALEAGVMVAFIQYIQRMYHPVRDLAEKYNIMQAAMASSERIFMLLDNPPTIKNPPNPKRPAQLAGAVQFSDVWLSYHLGEPVLRGISFKVHPGEKVALVGATGAGKTSIISSLCRFYEIDRGQILVDGVDIREWNKQELRRHLGLVAQDAFLFSGDIANNITLGDQRISDERMLEAARRVHIAPFIEKLPMRYQEEVQERGATLSQGQRQLLSFARALAFNPKILILDEATSSVDTETEVLIQEALKELLKDRTAIIIAHRLSTIRNVGRILVIHKGEIWEEGSHEELLSRQGLYSRLYELQYCTQENGLENLRTPAV